MTFVSYAQNFEDVLLWRALGSIGPGFYIDVGAAHPDADSVTRALYDRGWSGINIEPVAASAHRLQAARPRDITLQLALGESPGRTSFFVVQATDTGLSTTNKALLALFERERFDVARTDVAVDTLAEVCRRHVSGPIHVLKVDVEGAERAVLAGADFTAFRPWIVLVEATAPMSTVETHADWEYLLLAADYRFVWFDGLNRFYVAAERANLTRHFRVPPNVFDDFVRVADTDWAVRISRAEALHAAAALRARIAEEKADGIAVRAAAQVAELHAMIEVRNRQRRASEASLDETERARERAVQVLRETADWALSLERRVIAQEHAIKDAQAREAAIRASTSWRLTAPLRRAGVLARRRGKDVAQGGPPEPGDAPAPGPAAAPEPVAAEQPPVPPATRRQGRPLRTVHQFHAGSATGDAITASMLLTRRLLREMGYRSEIFVAQRDPALAHELRTMGELPQHDQYVLIARHSMGHRFMDQLLAVPAPKVLMYHNITPPEHLQHAGLQADARLGREQLLMLRPHVAAALADSQYNALELRRLGFDPVQACPVLIDPRTLAAPVRARAEGPFTVLFVGRIIESKGQLALVESFAQFCHPFAGPARLVLVGRHDGGGAYVDALSSAIRRHGLDAQVILTGPISDQARDEWYDQADLYVSLSQHEGFGVPLIEAMARLVPVLAWPAGAVAETLGGAGELLDDDAPSAVAVRMLALARDPRRRAAMAEAGRRTLDRFAPERHMGRMVEALIRAGAAPPSDREARGALASSMRFAIAGHVGGSYSLAAVNRALAVSIEAKRPGRVRLIPIEGQPTADLGRLPIDERDGLVRLAGRPLPVSGPEVVVSQHYPIHPPCGGDLPLALLFWEESTLLPGMAAELDGFQGVLAPTRFVAKVLRDSGVAAPVRLLGHAPRLAPFLALERPQSGAGTGAGNAPFCFLHVSSCFPRKGVDVLLAAYARAFRAGDAVELVIKSHPNPHNDVADQIARLEAADPGIAPIRLIDSDMGENALLHLYRDADAMVLPTRGEGYNLPAAEAMAAGLPLVVTGYGGHMDFCGPEDARLLAFKFAPSGSHLASPGSVWAEPDGADLVHALREIVAAPGPAQTRAAQARRRIAAASGDAVVDRLSEIALDLLLAPPVEPVRVAWVSPWAVRCGVAEYSRHLLSHLPGDGIAAVTVLADRRPPDPVATAFSGQVQPRIVPAWNLGGAAVVRDLAAALSAEDPHTVMVQHQPGLMPWPLLADLLRHPVLRERAVLVTLHNTLHLAEVEGRLDVLDALRGAGRLIVHTVADLNRLRGWGVMANTMLLPHGTPSPGPLPMVAALDRSGDVTIGCYGFLLPGKGVPELVHALSRLRDRWPKARLRLVTAAYPGLDGEAELAAVRTTIEVTGQQDTVELLTGFLPHDRSMHLLAGCDLAVLPYQASLEASSAALRTVLASGVPVAVTPLPLFDEAEAAVLRLPGIDPADIAEGISGMLDDYSRRLASAAAGRAWTLARGWDGIGRRVAGLLRNGGGHDA